MNAASSLAPAPLLTEGMTYWEKLVDECRERTDAINAVLSRHGLTADCFVNFLYGSELQMICCRYPSVKIRVRIDFLTYGPVISGSIRGCEADDLQVSSEEFEVPIGRDLDETVVGIFDEGRSFCPRELATYLTQRFRHCFPDVSLPA
jgi:hypothetical protein